MPAFAYVIAMPPPIVPAPTMAARRMSRAGVSLGTPGHLGRLTLGEEQVYQRPGFGRHQAIGEQLALDGGACIERQRDGGFDGVDRGEGRQQRRPRLLKLRAALVARRDSPRRRPRAFSESRVLRSSPVRARSFAKARWRTARSASRLPAVTWSMMPAACALGGRHRLARRCTSRAQGERRTAAADVGCRPLRESGRAALPAGRLVRSTSATR